MKLLKVIFIVFGVVALIFLSFMFQPWVFLPHNHIEISLPFAASDDATTGLIPMGEKIEHNAANGNPDGHAGIDFGFRKVTGILSVADGLIIGVKKNSEGTFDVTVSSGFYKVTYKEMNSIEPGTKARALVKKGQLLGYSGREGVQETKPQEGDPSRQIHWEFSSSSMFIDRLCPLGYFDADSRTRIEQIWANVPANDRFKKLYPDICSGEFKGKED